jgi:hypothetical protein
LAAVGAGASGGELIVNGGFETPVVAAGNCSQFFGLWALCANGEVPGWTATSVNTGLPALIELSRFNDAGFGPKRGRPHMKKLTVMVVVLALMALAAVGAGASGGELIVNGGFETPVVAAGNCSQFFGLWALCANGQVPGWTATSVDTGLPAFMELSRFNDAGIPPHSGDQKTELDSNQRVRISQQIATVPGAQYTLTYFWHWRTAPDVLEVQWDGSVLATYPTTGVPFAWQPATHVVTASGATTTVSFAEIGPSNGLGDGDTSPDGFGVGASTAEVRAERAGNGNGRSYHISFTADDGRGGACSGEVLVTVPKSRGNNGAAVDDGALYDSTVP